MYVNTRPLHRHISLHMKQSTSAAASFLNTFSEVSESVTHDHMLHYFKHNPNPIQHGFLKAKSTTNTLMTYLYFTSLPILNIKYCWPCV